MRPESDDVRVRVSLRVAAAVLLLFATEKRVHE
jgi:hypothetical protein